MKRLIYIFLTAIIALGCANSSKAVAMNEYNPSVSSTTQIAIVTPQKIKAVQKRRVKFMQEHPEIVLP